MTHDERVQAIEQAMELVAEAKYLVDSAIEGTHLSAHYNAYGRYGFDTLQGNGNPYDSSLDKLIEDLCNEDEDSSYEDEDESSYVGEHYN